MLRDQHRREPLPDRDRLIHRPRRPLAEHRHAAHDALELAQQLPDPRQHLRLPFLRQQFERLDELVEEGSVLPDTAERLRGLFGFRVNRFRARFDDEDDGAIEERSVAYQRVVRQLLDAERAELVDLRNQGVIDSAVMQRVQRDLDLEAARLDQ